MSIHYSKGFFKAVEKGWTKEFNNYKKKLNKTQLKKLDKYLDKQVRVMNSMIDQFGPMIQVTQGTKLKRLKKTDPIIRQQCTGYIMYTLLKMKRKQYPKYTGPGPDPYNCGPEYFRPQCCNGGYHYDWSNDRR